MCYWLFILSLVHNTPTTTLQICLHGFQLGFSWLYLIVEVLLIRAKFLWASGYSTVINCNFTFCITDVFNSFNKIMAFLELVKNMFTY